MGTEYAKDNVSSINKNLPIYTDSQAIIKAIIGQNRQSYHSSTIKNWKNLIKICQVVDEINVVYCLAHKGIPDNEAAISLAKVASKKAKHLPQRPDISLAKISKANEHLTLQKWQMRWENLKCHKYKQIVWQINSVGLKQRSLQLRHTYRVASKILWLKSFHCMLNAHQSRVWNTTKLSNCETCQAKETSEHYLLHCKKYEKEREVLFISIKNTHTHTNTTTHYILTLTMEDVLGEQNFMHDDHKTLREAFEKYINSTKKD